MSSDFVQRLMAPVRGAMWDDQVPLRPGDWIVIQVEGRFRRAFVWELFWNEEYEEPIAKFYSAYPDDVSPIRNFPDRQWVDFESPLEAWENFEEAAVGPEGVVQRIFPSPQREAFVVNGFELQLGDVWSSSSFGIGHVVSLFLQHDSSGELVPLVLVLPQSATTFDDVLTVCPTQLENLESRANSHDHIVYKSVEDEWTKILLEFERQVAARGNYVAALKRGRDRWTPPEGAIQVAPNQWVEVVDTRTAGSKIVDWAFGFQSAAESKRRAIERAQRKRR